MIESAFIKDFMHALTLIAVVSARLTAVVSALPFFAPTVFPAMVKAGLVLALLVPLWPVIGVTADFRTDSFMVTVVIVFKEVFIGFLIGFLVSIIFWAAKNAGDFFDYERGAAFAQMQDEIIGAEALPFGKYLYHLTTVLFFACGGFQNLLKGIYESYKVWPVPLFYPAIDRKLGVYLLGQVDFLMRMALLIVAPVVIAGFLAEFGLGLMNRVAPQLNVFSISMPVKSGIGMAVFVIYFQYAIPYLNAHFNNFTVIEVLKALI